MTDDEEIEKLCKRVGLPTPKQREAAKGNPRYNTLTNEFGDRIMDESKHYSTAYIATHKESGVTAWFNSEQAAKIWLNKQGVKAKKWTKSYE